MIKERNIITLEDEVVFWRFCVLMGHAFEKMYGTIICYLLLSFVVCLKFVYEIWKR